ncbi:MAG: hypothetical protein PQJ58_20425 [Spirochaetales bacterium]|nr:hypothetical protein [Spirochaetales bacterium]
MKLSVQAESWLFRYERALSRHLPLKGRKDIQEEIRSHMLDDLEDRFGTQEVDEDLMKEYLQKQGAPRCKAAAYKSDPFPLNEELFSFFKLMSSIVLIVVGVVLLITQAVSLGMNGVTASGVLKVFGTLFSALTSTLGSIVIVFMILGKFLPEEKWMEADNEESWTVDLLPEKEFPDTIPVGEMIADLVFTVIAIVLFLFFRNLLGIHNFSEQGYRFIPVFTDRFWSLVPLFMIRWILGIVFNSVMLKLRRWSLSLRLSDLALKAFSLAVTILILRIGYGGIVLTQELTSAGYGQGVKIFRIVFIVVMILGIVGGVAEIIKKIVALYREPVKEE